LPDLGDALHWRRTHNRILRWAAATALGFRADPAGLPASPFRARRNALLARWLPASTTVPLTLHVRFCMWITLTLDSSVPSRRVS
jgi:hypothetical protein